MLKVEKLLTYLPVYYQISDQLEETAMYQVLRACAEELQISDEADIDLLRQFFVQTATWGLSFWEEFCGIEIIPDAPIEKRRAKVLAKIQSVSPFTKQAAINLANTYSQNKTAKVDPRPKEYAFKTQHEVDDIIDLIGLIAAFEEMKPAHLLHVIGLLIRLNVSPNVGGKVRAQLRIWLREQFTIVKLKTRLIVTGETPGSSKYQAPFVNGVKNQPPTLYWNGAWDTNGYYKMDGQNSDGSHLYNRQSETLTIRQKDKASGQVVQTWTEIDRPK